MESLRALYYPYSRCFDETTLKRMILVFDTILFVDPLPPAIRNTLLKSMTSPVELTEQWKKYESDYALFFESNILKYVDPTSMVRQYDNLFTAAFASDNSDDDFWKLCLTEDAPENWYILKERIPPSIFDQFQESWNPGYLYYVMDQARYALENNKSNRELRLVWSDRVPAHTAPELSKKRSGDSHGFVEASPKEIFDNIFRKIYSDDEVGFEIDFQMLHNRKCTEYDKKERIFSCLFSFAHGSSIAINQALLLSEIHNASLVTNSQIHHQLLALKYKRASSANEDIINEYPALNIQRSPHDLYKYGILSFNLFNQIFDDNQLSNLSPKQCYKYREESREPMKRLQELLVELSLNINSEIWDVRIEKEINNIIHSKILPEIRKIENDLHKIKSKMFANLFVSSVGVAVPTLLATIYPNINGILMLLL